ncbi:MAG: hypothetical protein WB780_00435 [Candidatus Acidiferrales bacterium]
MLPEDIDHELVDLYRAWDAIERAQYKNSIIDFDLAPVRRFVPLRDRNEVRKKLENAQGALEGERTSLGALARARLRASTTYLRVLGGESIPFGQYVNRTLGIEPRMFTNEEIAKQREITSDRLFQQYEIRFVQEELSRFQANVMLYNRKLIRKQFDDFREKWIPALLDRIPAPLEKYRINVKFASEDAYWKNWISGNLSEHEILLRINIHPRQYWYRGFTELLVIHEYCGHAIQMVNWHRRIEEKKLPEFFGILTVHFPDQFELEGLAESLAFVLPDKQKLEAESLVARDLHRYYLMVMNNVHILANEQSFQTAMDYGTRHLPLTNKDVLSKEISDRTRNPLFRGYQYVYGIAKESFLKALSRFGPESRWDLLRFVYDWPMTQSQFEKSAEQLAEKITKTG